MLYTHEIRELHREPEKYGGQEVTLCGWVRTLRDAKSLAFLEINDGTSFTGMQIVMDEGTKNFEEGRRSGTGSAVKVTGTFILTPEAKQPYEVKASAVELIGSSPEEYPLQKKRHSFEYLREIAHLRPRTNTFSAVFRVRSLLAAAIHEFFQKRGFVYVHSPIITCSDCEGAGEMFQVTTLDVGNPPRKEGGEIDYEADFFGKKASLTVSGQLNAETYALAFGKVYTFGPTFRAENSNTTRHAAEFWMIEPEIAFADITDDMQLAEDMMKYTIRYVLDKAPQEMEFFNKFVQEGILERLNFIVNSDFERMTYTEAVKQLQKSGEPFAYPVSWGTDLQTEHERYLTEKLVKKPVFVIDYPKEIKAFYMRLNNDDKTVAAMDLLVPGVGEIIGGSQREERLDVLQRRIRETGMDESAYWWYLDLRRFGGTPHAGYGLGFERALMYITGMQNIRDCVPFPRTVGNAQF